MRIVVKFLLFLKSFFVGDEPGDKLFFLLGTLFTGTLLISNCLSSAKMCVFCGFDLSGGTVIFPLSYFLNDAISSLYDPKKVRRTLGSSILLLFFFAWAASFVGSLPATSYWSHQDSYDHILGGLIRTNAASTFAIAVGLFFNFLVVSKLSWMGNSFLALALRFILSTVVGEAFDTVIFLGTIFYDKWTFDQLMSTIFSQWKFKVLWETFAILLTVSLVKLVARYEWGVFAKENKPWEAYAASR